MKYGICNTKYASRDTQYQFETIYICRGCSTNQPFYTKQTQSQGRSNECKLFSDKRIYENGQLVKSENKPNSNPILLQLRNPFFQPFYSLLDLPIYSLLGFIVLFCQNGTKIDALEYPK